MKANVETDDVLPLDEYLSFWTDYESCLAENDLVLAWPGAPRWARVIRSDSAASAASELAKREAYCRTIDVKVIDGRRCRSLREFYKTWGRTLRFPRYYGQNSHALTDLTSDLLKNRNAYAEWMKCPNAGAVDVLLVLIDGADSLLDKEPHELPFLLMILGLAATDLPVHEAGPVSDPVLLKVGFVVRDDRTILKRVTPPLAGE